MTGGLPQVANWLDQASVLDACDAVGLSDDAPGFFPADCPAGTIDTTVTFASDADTCNQSGEDASTVTVEDTTAPALQGVPGDATVECDAVPAPPAVTADDVCSGALPVSFNEQKADSDCPGNYTLDRTWSASDSCSNETVEEQILTVQDTTPPVVTPGGEIQHCLWPPNHGYVCFFMDDFAPVIMDNCSEPIEWAFAGCQSNQPDDAPGGGDGHTTDDCMVSLDGGSFCVRAERGASGPGAKQGRRYAVSVTATDACGNESQAVVIGNIHVPFSGQNGQGCLSAP